MNMAAVRFPRGISYEDFLSSVDEGTHAEWVDGEVVRMSPSSERHEAVAGFLYAVLRFYVRRTEAGGRVLHAPFQMKLGRSGREPDVFYVPPERMDALQATFYDGPAALAIEVVSPDSRVRDRTEKLREYEAAGVKEYWVIDPMQRSAEVHRLSAAGRYELVPPGEPPRLRSEVIPGLWIDPEWLWAEEPDEWVAYKEWGLV
jgi:Uma2 family endonuclease